MVNQCEPCSLAGSCTRKRTDLRRLAARPCSRPSNNNLLGARSSVGPNSNYTAGRSRYSSCSWCSSNNRPDSCRSSCRTGCSSCWKRPHISSHPCSRSRSCMIGRRAAHRTWPHLRNTERQSLAHYARTSRRCCNGSWQRNQHHFDSDARKCGRQCRSCQSRTARNHYWRCSWRYIACARCSPPCRSDRIETLGNQSRCCTERPSPRSGEGNRRCRQSRPHACRTNQQLLVCQHFRNCPSCLPHRLRRHCPRCPRHFRSDGPGDRPREPGSRKRW